MIKIHKATFQASIPNYCFNAHTTDFPYFSLKLNILNDACSLDWILRGTFIEFITGDIILEKSQKVKAKIK